MIKILVDVNLSPTWTEAFSTRGLDAIHWTAVGDARSPDRVVMAWARHNGYIVFTHDLGFGALLALTHGTGPSVVQGRTHDVMPDRLAEVVTTAIRRYESELQAGIILTIDELRSRIRILPIV